MFVKQCNNQHVSFGSKVFTTPGACAIIKDYSPAQKKLLTTRIKELEKNNNKDVVVFDACQNVRDLYMTVYTIVKGKLHQGEFPTRFPLNNEFNWYYTRESELSSKIPVKKTKFDKYNPLWTMIENTLRGMNK